MIRSAEAVELRAHGGRCTQGRMEILRTLAASAPEHLTAQEIHERVCAAGWVTPRSTVNRMLLALAAAGMTHTLADARPSRYGMADPPHHHLLCRQCGSLTDLPVPELAASATAVKRTRAFQLAPEGLTLHGSCPRCHAAR